ncbi:MAG: LytTR family transcriptional regulator DNA-binding domain-containing protein [Bacteroidales bacterium]|nr:LytTR family transcriptional regulator DNA-binding domain-containing protein [Bacteroidales bacterium]
MIRCIIIDDETPARSLVREYLTRHSDIEIVAECANGFDGLKAIQDLKPDLIFLDIQMPKLTGFEMLELLVNKPAIVFTTAYEQFAIQAFECNASDYLLKPFTPTRFDDALARVRRQIENHSGQSQVDTLIQSVKNETKLIDRVVVKSGSKIKILPVESILCIEAADDYVLIHTHSEQFIKNDTMSYYEERLPAQEFLRVHRSFLVALSAIESIEPYTKETHSLKLSNGLSVKTSRNGSQRLKQILGR